MSQQSPDKPSSLLNSQNVPLTKPQREIKDLSREAGRIARHLEGLTKSMKQLNEKLKEAT